MLEQAQSNIILHGIQLLAQATPISGIGKVGYALTTGDDLLAHIEFFGEKEGVAGCIFYTLPILSLDRHEAVGSEHSELQCDALTVGRGSGGRWAEKLAPVGLALFVNSEKKLAGRGNGDGVKKRGVAHLLGGEAFRCCVQTQRSSNQKQGSCSEILRKHEEIYTLIGNLSKPQNNEADSAWNRALS